MQHVAVAARFAAILKEWLTESEWEAIRTLNASAAYQNGSCASHDFCDANEAMQAAFEAVMGRSPLAGDGMTESDCTLWNASWTYARQSGLIEAK